MVIYGITVLAVCFFLGMYLGDVIGMVVGVDSNVGGVGIAMVLLILTINYLIKKGKIKKESQEGISFWSSMYIPIVVAMTAKQNVVAALDGGLIAILAGVLSVVVCFALIPVLSKIGGSKGAAQGQGMERVKKHA